MGRPVQVASPETQGGGQPTAAVATATRSPVWAAVNPPQREQPQREARSGRRSTHRSRSNHNGRPGQGGGEPTAVVATATGRPVTGNWKLETGNWKRNLNGRPGQGGGQPTTAIATSTGGPVRAVVNPPQREQPQREAQSGRQPTNRIRSNLNGRSGQGGGQPTAAGATATGGPVRAAVNPPQQEQPQREAQSGRW
jgi:hypothetical protein